MSESKTYLVCMICNCPAGLAYVESIRAATSDRDGYLAVVCHDCAHERLSGHEIADYDRGERAINVGLLHRVQREARRLAASLAKGHDRSDRSQASAE